MRYINLLILLSFMLIIALPGPAGETTAWTLWPGESQTYQGVTITWTVPESPKNAIEAAGWLNIQGPQRKMEKVPFALRMRQDDVSRPNWHDLFAYLDGVNFFVEFRQIVDNSPDISQGIKVAASQQSDRFSFSGNAYNNQTVYLSEINPVTLDSWRVGLSAKPVRFPDGSEFHQIIAKDTKTGETVTFPAYRGATRQFGRFTFYVSQFCEETLTAVGGMNVARDPSIRGKDAYVDRFTTNRNETIGDFLDRCAKDYGFEVTWKERPEGLPESIEYARNRYVQERDFGNGILEELMGYSLGKQPRSVELEWIDSTHLVVYPKDYDKVLNMARQDEQNRLAREQAEQSFKTDYTLETRVYRLQSITSDTAKALVDPILDEYSRGGDKIYNREQKAAAQASSQAGFAVDESVMETAVADAKSGALIVSAIPATHARIQEILARTDRIISQQPETKGAPKVYRIESTLLQGQGSQVITLSNELPYTNKVIQAAEAGARVKEGDLVIQFDPGTAQQNLTFAQKKRQTMEELLQNAQQELSEAEQRAKAGVVSQSEVRQAKAKVSEVEIQLEAAKAEEQVADKNLQGMKITTPVSGVVQSVRILPSQSVASRNPIMTIVPDETATAPSEGTLQLLKRAGLSIEDLQPFGLTQVWEVGSGSFSLFGERSEVGKALAALGPHYQCALEFHDYREPYLVARGRLIEVGSGTILLENTLFLEPGKPSVLGLTNLRDALILVLRMED